MAAETTLLIDGLRFPETPRWHDHKLWFSDMVARQVKIGCKDSRFQGWEDFNSKPFT
jgi:hypothetical protein